MACRRAGVRLVHGRGIDVIEVLRALCQVLARSAVTAREVASELGTITEDRGEGWPLVVAPRSAEIAEAKVVRQAGTDEPAYVELTFAPASVLPVREMVAAFGAYTPLPRLRPGAPSRVAFYPRATGATHTCAIIAEVRPGEQGIEDGIVPAVTVRRDVKLE